LLRPTIRADGSELWFSWNPEKDSDPIDVLLCGENPPPDSIVVHANYSDNPFLPEVLREEMEYDKARDFEKYLHVWEGKYKKISEAIVFKNTGMKKKYTASNGLIANRITIVTNTINM
jgi:phage terminase large subunit